MIECYYEKEKARVAVIKAVEGTDLVKDVSAVLAKHYGTIERLDTSHVPAKEIPESAATVYLALTLKFGCLIDGEALEKDLRKVEGVEEVTVRRASSPVKQTLTRRTFLKWTAFGLSLPVLEKLFGCGPGTKNPTPPQPEPEPLTPVQAMLRWILGQQNPATFVGESFGNTLDAAIKDQGATYDQALMIISFILGQESPKAGEVMAFFIKKWQQDPRGFANFYKTDTGMPGLAKVFFSHAAPSRVHTGPSIWIAMAALALDEGAADAKYLDFAVEIARWAAYDIRHIDGGIAMGPEDDQFPWTDVFATEHNIDYAALLQKLLTHEAVLSATNATLFKTELVNVKSWIKARYSHTAGLFNRGVSQGVEDTTKALDTTTFLVLAFGAEELRQYFGVDVEALIKKTEEAFGVTTGVAGTQIVVSGFDFTNTSARPAVAWFEGMGQMGLTYTVAGDPGKSTFYQNEIERSAQVYSNGARAIPYAV